MPTNVAVNRSCSRLLTLPMSDGMIDRRSSVGPVRAGRARWGDDRRVALEAGDFEVARCCPGVHHLASGLADAAQGDEPGTGGGMPNSSRAGLSCDRSSHCLLEWEAFV